MVDTELRKYHPKFKEQLIDFLGTGMSWEELSDKKRKELFEWKYEKNPYTEKPLCFLALHDDKVVGHRGFVAQKFRSKKDEHLFAIPGDSMVHTDYRRLGIFSDLVEFSNNDIIYNSDVDLFLSLSTTKATTEATKRYGYVPVGERKKLYRFSIKNIFNYRYNDGIDLNKTISSKKTGHTIEITDEVKKEDMIDLMDSYKKDKKLKNLRDEEFYRWRFEECPNDHIFIYFWNRDELEAYVSMEKDKFPFFGLNLDYYSLLEYGYTEIRIFEELVKTLTKKLSLPFIMSYIFTRKEEEISTLRDHGFKGSDSYLINSLQNRGLLDEEGLPGILVRPASKKVGDKDFYLDNTDTRKEKNWSLFWSDVH